MNIDEVRALLKERGFELQSTEYINSMTKLDVVCSKGHLFHPIVKSIKKGSGCPVCCIKYTKEDKLLISQKTAEKRGGKLIHDPSVPIGKDKLLWECVYGHRWQARFYNVISRHSWCPYCKSTYSENICRQYMEHLFEKQFPKSRPDWIKANSDRSLELDGYCESLGIAFEHQGLQHYQKVEIFRTPLEKQKSYDDIKRNLCKKNNVVLIEVPALFYLTTLADLPNVIKTQLDDANVSYDTSRLQPVFDIIDLDTVNIDDMKKQLKRFREFVKTKGGDCLSTIYHGNNSKLEFICKFGHKWKTTAAAITRGTWCPTCASRARSAVSIEDAQALAKERGGVCISTEYNVNYEKLKWQCSCGNVWDASYNSIQAGTWCPPCSIKIRSGKKRLNIEPYIEAAKRKGGKCLSTNVYSCYDKLEFECDLGHKWFAPAHAIKNTGNWCPVCANKRRGNRTKMPTSL